MNHRKSLWFLCLLFACLIIFGTIMPAWATPKPIGIAQFRSSFNITETAQRLEAQIQSRNLTLVAKVDHAAAAKNVSLDLLPTQVYIFGNPRGGTPLMQCNQTAGIDLPLKALIWQDQGGDVWFGYNTAGYLGWRHQFRRCDRAINQNLRQIDQTLQAIAIAVTRK
jgi:uncharacterized protein (DUF302 family)